MLQSLVINDPLGRPYNDTKALFRALLAALSLVSVFPGFEVVDSGTTRYYKLSSPWGAARPRGPASGAGDADRIVLPARDDYRVPKWRGTYVAAAFTPRSGTTRFAEDLAHTPSGAGGVSRPRPTLHRMMASAVKLKGVSFDIDA
ncbi:hypothetical protein GGTG_02301 [Gaeumannomyces tritici R3-111a-1]|uniref:Uncharacterized protein n=1 Tax=Gaeumannomyces tritici (strain R3-111a-1) TaxID=644352 RepID=J3NLZ6_GAET3|nr:hypothetical protein GGTG_02301 [Gaeumannomyces tritici R3-111a-1]EJT82327.1 hypothetical protein GGTG_02301 [Gaeumannomyces tritici R3-111a-1]